MTHDSLRRPSYGAHSPVVGKRGARTRQRILDAALTLIERDGLHDVHVDDIAAAAQVSRATLYQYFDSKQQVFAVLLEECGSALVDVLDRLGPLGPTAKGLENLYRWLGQWTAVYDRYAVLFAQWAQLEWSGTPLREGVARFVEQYASRIDEQLESAGSGGAGRADTAIAVTLTVHRSNAFLRSDPEATAGMTDEEVLGNLAVILQLVMFPETPSHVLATRGTYGAARTVVPPPPREREDRFADRSDRVRGTVRQLLDAAARCLELRGYAGTSIDDIAGEGGVTRSAVYLYFTDKLDLLETLAQEGSAELRAVVERMPASLTPPLLSAWLIEYVTAYRRHSGVVQVWTQEQTSSPVVRQAGREVGAVVMRAVATLLTGVRRTYPLDLRVGVVVMAALLERLPHGLAVRTTEVSVEEVATTMAAVIVNGLLNPGRG